MLRSVCPERYNIEGQYGWAETIQWWEGKVYDLPDLWADWFVVNEDAEWIEE